MGYNNVTNYKTISSFIDLRLNKVEKRLRRIDPSLLGESGSLCSTIKKIILYPVVKKLIQSKIDLDSFKSRLRAIDPQLVGEARYDPGVVNFILSPAIKLYYLFNRQFYSSTLPTLGEEIQQKFGPIQGTYSYKYISLAEEQKDLIRRYAEIGAKYSPLQVIASTSEISQAKEKLNRIHPLKWLEFMFSDPTALNHLKQISQSKERWVGITILGRKIDGFKPRTAARLMRMQKRGQILPHLFSFIKNLKLDHEQSKVITALAKKGKWEEIIQSLVDFKKPSVANYKELAISDDEKQEIKKLMKMVAQDTIPSLIKQLPSLMAAKEKLYKIHPLKSFELMLNDAETLENLKELSKNSQRWVGVPLIAAGFKVQSADKFKSYHSKNAVLPLLPDFIQRVGLKGEQAKAISELATQEKWPEMIQSLLEFKTQS